MLKGKLFPYKGLYSVDFVNRYPSVFFIFGDNSMRVGMGGQAIIRNCRNAVGIATKRSPGEYMEDGSTKDMAQVLADMLVVEGLLDQGRTVVMPVFEDGKTTLGCGLAELHTRAPSLYGFIDAWTQRLFKEYST